MTKDDRERSKNSAIAGWFGAGFAIGFACGYLLLDSVASGVILGIGLALVMGATAGRK